MIIIYTLFNSLYSTLLSNIPLSIITTNTQVYNNKLIIPVIKTFYPILKKRGKTIMIEIKKEEK
jgi:hypothetical protein